MLSVRPSCRVGAFRQSTTSVISRASSHTLRTNNQPTTVPCRSIMQETAILGEKAKWKHKMYMTEYNNMDLYRLVQENNVRGAHAHFQQMKEAGYINIDSWEFVMQVFDESGFDLPKSTELFEEMKKLGYTPSRNCWESLIAAHATSNNPQEAAKAKGLAQSMKEHGLEWTDRTYVSLDMEIPEPVISPDMQQFMDEHFEEALCTTSSRLADQDKEEAFIDDVESGEPLAYIGSIENITPEELESDEAAVEARINFLANEAGLRYGRQLAKENIWMEVERDDFPDRLPLLLGAESLDQVRPEDLQDIINWIGKLGPEFACRMIMLFGPQDSAPSVTCDAAYGKLITDIFPKDAAQQPNIIVKKKKH